MGYVFFENFLHRLSQSKFKNKFVFKGGFLLESLLGIKTRTTMDVDLKIVNDDLDENILLDIFNQIISLDIGDEINYNIISIKDIVKDMVVNQ